MKIKNTVVEKVIKAVAEICGVSVRAIVDPKNKSENNVKGRLMVVNILFGTRAVKNRDLARALGVSRYILTTLEYTAREKYQTDQQFAEDVRKVYSEVQSDAFPEKTESDLFAASSATVSENETVNQVSRETVSKGVVNCTDFPPVTADSLVIIRTIISLGLLQTGKVTVKDIAEVYGMTVTQVYSDLGYASAILAADENAHNVSLRIATLLGRALK